MEKGEKGKSRIKRIDTTGVGCQEGRKQQRENGFLHPFLPSTLPLSHSLSPSLFLPLSLPLDSLC